MKTEIKAFVLDVKSAFREVSGDAFVEIPEMGRVTKFQIPVSEEMFKKIAGSMNHLGNHKLKITVELLET